MKCKSNMCQNQATIELMVKTDSMVAFLRGDESKNETPYEWRPTKHCDEHAQEIRDKHIIQFETKL